MNPSFVDVLLPLPFSHPFTYTYEKDLHPFLERGHLVKVPFGSRFEWGVVWGFSPPPSSLKNLKSIQQIHEGCPLPLSLLSFLEWVSRYTMSPLGKVLKMALYTKALDPERVKKPSSSLEDALVNPFVVSLNKDQRKAADLLRKIILEKNFQGILLDGVTGSGKTEVYFEAIAQALEKKLQVLVLLPEIALTSQWVDRFKKRFGFYPFLWHSHIPPAQRKKTWKSVYEGNASVVVGARSALFLPFLTLGLIVVDEEHDPSFKQEEGVIYHGRDMAIVRAHGEKIPIILASATPSLETFQNAQKGKYLLISLKNRHGKALLPSVELVDLRKFEEKREEKNIISPPLHQALEETLKEGEQALLFLNRRGFAPLTLCKKCGHRIHCPSCSVTLVDHRRHLLCHQCGYQSSKPSSCPECHEENCLISWGPGVEKLSDEVKRRYPEARSAILSSDTLGSLKEIYHLIEKIENHEVDLLIGTQLIAKGYHFPNLTLVGVVDGDMGLSGGDPRASERTFQLLSQVSGRSGRGEKPGRVFIQSHMPEHPVMEALKIGDRDLFLTREGEERKAFGLPPYGRLAALIISGKNALEVEKTSRDLGRCLPSFEGQVWGPAPAPLNLVRGRYRWRFLIQSSSPAQNFIQEWISQFSFPRSIHLQIDIDPYNFL